MGWRKINESALERKFRSLIEQAWRFLMRPLGIFVGIGDPLGFFVCLILKIYQELTNLEFLGFGLNFYSNFYSSFKFYSKFYIFYSIFDKFLEQNDTF